jgi:hypothetical protein
VIAGGPPEVVFTEEILNRTYHGDMVVVRQDGLLLIHQRPHPHTHRDLLPNPVLGHPGGPPVAPANVSAPAGVPNIACLISPVLPAKEAAGDLVA